MPASYRMMMLEKEFFMAVGIRIMADAINLPPVLQPSVYGRAASRLRGRTFIQGKVKYDAAYSGGR